MTLKDTAELMTSSNYKDRFIAEYLQLSIRYSGLANMLTNYKNGTLNFKPTCSYELLSSQLEAMGMYLALLEERASIEGIILG